ncbi:MAG: hypothetical protein Kow00121_36490 [Elainellaceae cyanobacterium]
MSYTRWQWSLVCAVGMALLVVEAGQGQPVPDETLGEARSRVIDRGSNNFDIDGGAIRDSNLFHSFQEFGVAENGSVYFLNPDRVTNIFSRVTGANRSDILGTLGVRGGANLFLMNPNGILFGTGARLDVQGSFVGTTANAIGFGEQGFFSATNPELPSQLLVVSPSAFLFNQIPISRITNQSTSLSGNSPAGFAALGLRVPDGESLLLLGGDIAIDGGRLNAFGGEVELGGLAGLGTVGLHQTENALSFSFVPNSALADITLANDARVAVRGGGGGNIVVNADEFTATEGGRLVAGVETTGNAGSIIVNANRLDLIGAGLSGLGAGIYQEVLENATGNTGNIEINTRLLTVASGGQIRIQIRSDGTGDAGSVIIMASDRAIFQGRSRDGQLVSAAFSNVVASGNGRGGNIEITAPILEVLDGAGLSSSTFGQGDAGSIIIRASDRAIFQGRSRDRQFDSAALSSVAPSGNGRGGNIEITTPILEVLDGARLSASTFGEGDAGSVIITATDRVTFQGESEDGQFVSVASSSVEESGIGSGGNIEITTPILEVLNGAALSASTLGQGDAGSIIITATDRVLLNGASSGGFSSELLTSTSSTATGRGGRITVTTPDLRIANGAVVNAQTDNARRGGNIVIEVEQFTALNGGQVITTTLSSGRAGTISVTADRILLAGTVPTYRERLREFGRDVVSNQGSSSGLFANTRSGSTGNGGRITVNSTNLTMQNRARISAQSQGTGAAGGVNIRARGDVSLSDRARISTESLEENALAGNIRIEADNSFSATDSDVITSAANASGGNISFTAGDVRLLGDSDIRTNSAQDGGNITFNANSLVAFEDSDIIAAASQQGGDIAFGETIAFFENYDPDAANADPNTLEDNNGADFNATGAEPGDISILDTTFIQNSLSDLPEVAIDADSLIANSCIARSEDGGTFLITGSGGLPVRPGVAPLSPYPGGEVRTEPEADDASSWQPGDPVVEPQGVYQLPDGQLVMSRECQ